MLLAVDIGNTSTKFGIFKGEDLVSRFSVPTSTDQIAPTVDTQLGYPLSRAIVCSVVPAAAKTLIEFLSKKQINTKMASNDLDFGFTINYEPISSLGTDRLVNAFAAVEKYGAPAIVCTFGTATTIDVIDKNRVFLGGIIAPGLKTAAGSLRSSTSLLPDISIERPETLIGTSTESAIRSGVVFGHVAMIEGLIKRMITHLGDRPYVIATGGFSPLVAEMTSIFDACDENLTLKGLRILENRSAGRATPQL